MKTLSIKSCLEKAIQILANSSSSHLDAEILLAHVLKKNRAFLKAYAETELTEQDTLLFFELLQERAQAKPMAYILSSQDFWSLNFEVNSNVLIPRPETELIVDYVLSHFESTKQLKLLELGTGSGAIAISLAKSKPTWQITATDISVEALALAQQNAKRHACSNISFILSDWYGSLNKEYFDVIISNPPYIAADDPHLEDAVKNYEPKIALIAGDQGMACLKEIISGALSHLNSHGLLILEHGWQQADRVQQLLSEYFCSIKTLLDLQALPRTTLGFLR